MVNHWLNLHRYNIQESDKQRLLKLPSEIVNMVFPGYYILEMEFDMASFSDALSMYSKLGIDLPQGIRYILEPFPEEFNAEKHLVLQFDNYGNLTQEYAYCVVVDSIISNFVYNLFDPDRALIGKQLNEFAISDVDMWLLVFKRLKDELSSRRDAVFERVLIHISVLALELYSKYDFYPDPYELYDVLTTCENKIALHEIMQEAVKYLPERRLSL